MQTYIYEEKQNLTASSFLSFQTLLMGRNIDA